MRFFTLTYWSDKALTPSRKQEKRFATLEEALRFAMVLDPRFRLHIEDHDDATGGMVL